MAFNNGLERKRFEAKQKALRAEYERLGMSEEQIQKLYEYDLADFNSDRRYITHTQPINLADLEADEDASAESGRNPLFEKFREVLSISDNGKLSHSRYDWIEEIDNPILAKKLKQLPPDDLELLTLLVFDEHTQDEAATIMGISDRTVRRKLTTWKNILKNF